MKEPTQKTEPGKARIEGHFHAGAGLEIVGKWGKDIFSGGVRSPVTSTTRLWHLSIPIYPAYHFAMSNSPSIIIQAGFCFGYALGSHFKDDQGTQKVTFGKQGDITRGDYGIAVHLGYTLPQSPFSVWAITEIGIINITPAISEDGDKTKNQAFGLEVGYQLTGLFRKH